jgi:hypothetical protein
MKAYEQWHAAYALHQTKKLTNRQEEEYILSPNTPNEHGEQPDVATFESEETQATPLPIILNGDGRQSHFSIHESRDSQVTSFPIIPNRDEGPDFSTPESGSCQGFEPTSRRHVKNDMASHEQCHAAYDLEQKGQAHDISSTSSSNTVEVAGRQLDISIPESRDTEAPVKVTAAGHADGSHDTEMPFTRRPEFGTTTGLIRAFERSFGIIFPLPTVR